jgi:hypothetical protein
MAMSGGQQSIHWTMEAQLTEPSMVSKRISDWLALSRTFSLVRINGHPTTMVDIPSISL